MAKDIRMNQSVENKQEQLDQQPVASRTRRLSSTLSVNNNCTAAAAAAATTSILDQEQNQHRSVIVEPTVKQHRNQHRLDYNALVNSSEKSNNGKVRKVARAYEKDEEKRSEDEIQLLIENAHLLPLAICYLKRKRGTQLIKQRLVEQEDAPEIIRSKADNLVELIRKSKYVIIYTGAGISTSASIPDYRGPNGLWTQIRRTGSFPMTKVFKDLCKAEPTYTHMAIRELCKRKIVKHIVSQNFDGLHLRSGIAPGQLSEIHGNMFIEICPTCERQYYRQADVTQKTVRFRHKTGRKCHTCAEPNNNLLDTIVLYGERSRSKWPMNWERASRAAKNADLIICMGSSLKTLRRYGCLWPKSITLSSTASSSSSSSTTTTTATATTTTSSMKHETKLVIVNLQHTSKDKNAVLKINGKCDLVMEHVMRRLNIAVPTYEISTDPLQRLAVPFEQDELAKLERNLIFGISAANTTNTASKLNGNSIKVEREEQEETKKTKRKSTANRECSTDSLEDIDISEEEDTNSTSSSNSQKRPKNEATVAAAATATDGKADEFKLEVGASTDDRYSPSLFVSELTDDPDKRRLRMRIRALTPSV